MRIVLHAEGAGETAGLLTLPPAPGTPLANEQLGAAHELLRRAVSEARSLPIEAVIFESPLRTSRGRVARGSDLLDKTTLRRLCSWPTRPPELVIVLVDADGDTARKRTLESHLEGLGGARVIAVAVQEFESWLIADQRALNELVDAPVAKPPAIEQMARREAKELLARLLAKHDDPAGARRTLALTCDLAVVARECAAFEALRRELRGS